MTPPEKRLPFSAVVLGITQVARGRPEGLGKFGNSPQAVMAAMTPLVAFMLVGGLLALVGGKADGLTTLVAVCVALLSPLVLSFEVARRWGRELQWPRFAAAFCWCQWATPVVFGAMLIAMSVLMAFGLDPDTALGIGVMALFCYGLWLHWFLARHALELTAWRAVILVLIVNVGTTILVAVPQLAGYLLNGPPT